MGVKIVIYGRPISKKNHKRLALISGRMIPISSKAYMQFEKDAMMQLLAYKKHRFTTPVHINYVFFLKGNYKVDCDNLIAGINDILEKSGIVENDNLVVSGSFKKVNGNADWRTELLIDILDIDI